MNAPFDIEDDSPDLESLLHELIDQMSDALEEGKEVDIEAVAASHPELERLLRAAYRTLIGLHGIAAKNSLPEELPSQVRELGDFRLLHEIGRGGMGIVYEAEQLSLERRVAIKVLPFAALLDGRQLRRFKNEARAAAMLKHPGIVSIHSVGCVRGVHYYSMELVEGQSLAELIAIIRNEPLRVADRRSRSSHGNEPASSQEPSENGNEFADDTNSYGSFVTQHTPFDSTRPKDFFQSVAQLGIQAAVALHYAHQEGVIHRDIKPSNLLIDNDGQIHVTDFGLARIVSDASLTMSGDLLGTLRYMSPEQAEGQPLVDQRSDIYSLGLTLYELATLRPAYGAESREELLQQVAQAMPKPPRQLSGHIPRDLETIILKAIAKEPSARYESAEALADDLQRFTEKRPIVARRQSRVTKAWHWARRNRAATTLIAIAVISLLALGIGGPVVAVKQIRLAEARRLQLYDAQVKVAQEAFDNHDYERCITILDGLRPNSSHADDLRRFEWHYLLQNSQRMLRGQTVKHWGSFLAVDVSPDGRQIVTGTWEGLVRVYDTNLQEVAWKTDRPPSSASTQDVEFFPAGSFIASGAIDGTLSLWDAHDGRPIRNIKAHPGPVIAIAFSSNRRWLAVSFADNATNANSTRDHQATVHIYQLDVEKKADQLDVQLNLVNEIEIAATRAVIDFSCDSSMLAVSDDAGTTALYDTSDWQQSGQLQSLGASAREIAFSPTDPDVIAIGTHVNDEDGRGGDVRFWNVESQRLTKIIPGLPSGTWSLCFSRDGNLIASGGLRGAARIWNVNTGQLEAMKYGHRAAICDLAFTHDGGSLVTASRDNTLRVWDWKQPKPTAMAGTHPISINRIAFSPDDQFIASGGSDGKVCLWETHTLKRLWSHSLQTRMVFGIDFSPDASKLLVCGTSWWSGHGPGELSILQTGSGKTAKRLRFHDKHIWSAKFSPDGSRIVTTLEPWLAVLDATTGTEIWKRLNKGTYAVDWSPNGRLIASYSHNGITRDNSVALWDAETGELMRQDDSNGPIAMAVAFHPNSRYLASRVESQHIIIRDVDSGALIQSFDGHTDLLRSLAFSPDGDRLVSSSWDETIRIWNVHTGAELLTLRAPRNNASDACFSHDGRMLATGESSNGIADLAPLRLFRAEPIEGARASN